MSGEEVAPHNALMGLQYDFLWPNVRNATLTLSPARIQTSFTSNQRFSSSPVFLFPPTDGCGDCEAIGQLLSFNYSK